MLPLRLALLLSLPALCAGSIPAQDAQRLLVHFATPGADLTTLRALIRARRSHAEVQAEVKRIEAQVADRRAAFESAVARAGGRTVARLWLFDGAAIEGLDLATASALPEVVRVEPDVPAGADLALLKDATNAANHNVDAVHARWWAGQRIRGAGVGVAVLDTGADVVNRLTGLPHAMFYRGGNPLDRTGAGIQGSLLLGAYGLGQTGDVQDTHNHGTWVTACAAGARWNDSGQADEGHAPDAGKASYKIVVGGVLSATTLARVLAWQQVVADRMLHNLVVAVNSWQGDNAPTVSVQQELDRCVDVGDVLVVVSAGNTGSLPPTTSQCAMNGLAVGAVEKDNRRVASFSTRGPMLLPGGRWREYPDLAAVGQAMILPTTIGSQFQVTQSGTSFAAPQVAGTAALLRSIRPLLSAAECKALLLNTTEDIHAQNPGMGRNDFGAGFLRSDAAVAAAIAHDVRSGVLAAPGAFVNYTVPLQANVPHAFTLTWLRTAANTGSPASTDLDLSVFDPSGALVGRSARSDVLWEKVACTPAVSGSFRVEVRCAALVGTFVEFALAGAGRAPAVQLPVLATQGPVAPATVTPGQPARFATVVRNDGASAAGGFDVEFWLSADAAVDEEDTVVARVRALSLAAGDAVEVSVDASIPWFTGAGTRWVAAWVDRRKEVEEAVFSEHLHSTTTTVAAAPGCPAALEARVLLSPERAQADFFGYGGGRVPLEVTAPCQPGGIYLLLWGCAGTVPGMPLGNGVTLPLNPDPLCMPACLALLNREPFVSFLGVLDAAGRATARLEADPGVFAPGASAFAAAVLAVPTLLPLAATNPVALQVQ